MNASFGRTITAAAGFLVAALALSPVAAQQKSTEPSSKSGREPFLSAKEEAEHEKKMQSFKTYQECAAYLAEHRKKIEALAKAQGRSLRNVKPDECDDMRKQGLLK
jgi:hypothetical protein